MRISSTVVIAVLSTAALGAVVATSLLTGTAPGGAKALRGPGTAPAPVPSVTFPPGVPDMPPNAAPPALTVEVAHSDTYGPILVTPEGMTIYRPVGGGSDDPGYHPLLATPHQPLRLPILVGGRLAAVRGSHGGRQVTYDGWPMYVYSGDHAQGDTNGAGPRWQVIRLSP